MVFAKIVWKIPNTLDSRGVDYAVEVVSAIELSCCSNGDFGSLSLESIITSVSHLTGKQTICWLYSFKQSYIPNFVLQPRLNKILKCFVHSRDGVFELVWSGGFCQMSALVYSAQIPLSTFSHETNVAWKLRKHAGN